MSAMSLAARHGQLSSGTNTWPYLRCEQSTPSKPA
jgi:hypothetical protein